MSTSPSPEQPVYAVPEAHLIPVSDHLSQMAPIPPSRMFLIKKSLQVFRQQHPDEPRYDASQGDGGASLPGVSPDLLQRASELLLAHGTAYDMPYGADDFRRAVIENYWQVDADIGIGPENVLATVGGRDGLEKAYQAMLALGHGRQGDALVVTRVPWISYNWGPYGVGANVLYAPGSPDEGWMYTEDSLQACADFAASSGRKIAGVIITCPDNPTGKTIPPARQAELVRAALQAGTAFVLVDWMYHYVTDEDPMDLNAFLRFFSPQERQRIMILDGITKSLGGSNIRNCHLIASQEVVKYIVARASHGVIPSYYAQAVAMAAYEKGYRAACQPIVEPTNASRNVLRQFLDQRGYRYILGKGYYAFIDTGQWQAQRGWGSSEPMGQYLAEQFGVAIVPGAFFSSFGDDWIRFSYATPPERTLGALERMHAGLQALQGN